MVQKGYFLVKEGGIFGKMSLFTEGGKSKG